LQRSQLPLQAESQHTPSAQNVDWHSELEPQLVPAVFRSAHRPLSQKRPEEHWREVVQVVGHEPLTPSHA
jgi:hypothetical protein